MVFPTSYLTSLRRRIERSYFDHRHLLVNWSRPSGQVRSGRIGSGLLFGRLSVWTKEYCQFESFNASCNGGHVILMTDARYGRLHLGRCMTRDYGHVGCSADVIDILDRTCSGQRWCQLAIPALRDVVQPCPKDLTAYLEASYTCIAGTATTARRPNVRLAHSLTGESR